MVRSNDWMTAQYMSMTDSFVAYGGTDSGYSYRRNVVVEAGPENIPAGHSVSVTFDHASLVLEGKAQIDGDDIRIVHWNATHWEEMDLTLDPDSSWNDNATTIWFTLLWKPVSYQPSHRDTIWTRSEIGSKRNSNKQH
jgi:hypothetical protein